MTQSQPLSAVLLTPTLLALDFDGVVCDGLIEYFQTAWKAYLRIWKLTESTPPDDLADRFYRTRPVVETGWEMPLVVRSLLQGMNETDILLNWPAIRDALVAKEHLVAAEIVAVVDGIRDEWIAADVNHWLAQHRFYPGVIDRLKQLLTTDIELRIITTKEGRFVRQLLQQQGIELGDEQILGKEVKQPKAQTLRDLFKQFGDRSVIWFVEDRLKTLQGIKPQLDLTSVGLFLADWGYNTKAERESIGEDDRIHLISLNQFAQPFSSWMN